MGRRETEPTIPSEGEIPLGTRIRSRRWFLGIYMEDFAKDLGNYRPSHISQIEGNKYSPSEELFDKITKLLQISDEELVFSPREQVMEWLEIGRQKARRGRHQRSLQG